MPRRNRLIEEYPEEDSDDALFDPEGIMEEITEDDDFDDREDDYYSSGHENDYIREILFQDEGEEEDGGGEAGGNFQMVANLANLAQAMNRDRPNENALAISFADLRNLIGRQVEHRSLVGARRGNLWAEKSHEKQAVADPKGTELLRSGEFGSVGGWKAGKGKKRPREWEHTVRGWNPPRLEINRSLVPNDAGTIVATYPSVPYVGQYAGENYSVFYTATQYFTLHLYWTAVEPPRLRRKRYTTNSPSLQMPDDSNGSVFSEDEYDDTDRDEWGQGSYNMGGDQEDSSMKRFKRVQGVEGRWTITDCDVDRKGERMIYSSITPQVHLLYTSAFQEDHHELDFSDSSDRNMFYGNGIWSIRFSADGKEIIAGGSNGKIMIYDLESQSRSLKVKGHADDVNAVRFADHSSTNVLVSGSDDGYVKVWDRRSLSSHVPSGVLVGATEGITYTSPKGDGRYIVANSKDQVARLYDLRKMRSWSDFDNQKDAVEKYGASNFDYRDSLYPRSEPRSHPLDCSVMTYKGHSVLRTLIRCHFSPVESTGQSYIYSGSADGQIHVWSLDGRVLDRSKSAPLYTPSGEYSDPSWPVAGSKSSSKRYTVRDVAWHGYEPTLMSTCWDLTNNVRRGGTVAKHEWKGLGKRGLNKLEDWVEKQQAESDIMGESLLTGTASL
ncbi:hypothetical protein L204_103418 [Cryptococcus depauperatus]|nr:hypothetical protein L204_01731 [Cryptococcus depauperatus CBS 7855]